MGDRKSVPDTGRHDLLPFKNRFLYFFFVEDFLRSSDDVDHFQNDLIFGAPGQ